MFSLLVVYHVTCSVTDVCLVVINLIFEAQFTLTPTISSCVCVHPEIV